MTILLYLGLQRWRVVSVAKLEEALYSTGDKYYILNTYINFKMILLILFSSTNEK